MIKLGSSSTAPLPRRRSPHLSKNNTILKIIRDNPDGKFIIFCNYSSPFHELAMDLKRLHISHDELRGHSDAKILNRFRQGALQVIMLHSRNNGSGIDISCATDIIFYQRLADESEDSQALARAQRVGRTTPLQVHRLYHRNELLPDATDYIIAGDPY